MEAARANAALQLSYTQITAPESGTISRKTVEVGQLVQPAQQLMSIVADTGAWVTANFKETQLAKMKVGQPVDIDIDAYSGCDATRERCRASAVRPARSSRCFRRRTPPETSRKSFSVFRSASQSFEGCGASTSPATGNVGRRHT